MKLANKNIDQSKSRRLRCNGKTFTTDHNYAGCNENGEYLKQLKMKWDLVNVLSRKANCVL